jgi:hypothetical protein
VHLPCRLLVYREDHEDHRAASFGDVEWMEVSLLRDIRIEDKRGSTCVKRELRGDLFDLIARNRSVVCGNGVTVPVHPSKAFPDGDLLETADDGLGGKPGVEHACAISYDDAVVLCVRSRRDEGEARIRRWIYRLSVATVVGGRRRGGARAAATRGRRG